MKGYCVGCHMLNCDQGVRTRALKPERAVNLRNKWKRSQTNKETREHKKYNNNAKRRNRETQSTKKKEAKPSETENKEDIANQTITSKHSKIWKGNKCI